MEDKKYFSLAEIAKILGVSRIAVYKKVKSGLIRAERVGRIYVIPREEMENLIGTKLSSSQKKIIDQGVRKTIKEYGEVLQMLGNQ